MTRGRTTQPRVMQLADRLAADIAMRGLKSGDRYLTTAEASKLLGVGNAAANKALQLLERRRLVVRQQRLGAFIIDPPCVSVDPTIDRVHFLVHQKYFRAEGVGQDEVLLGIEHELPGVTVQISFLPIAHEESFVNELLDESIRAKRTDGFILVRSSYETQHLLADRQIPTVVYGTVYPSIERLASLSSNMEAIGRILAGFLRERGHTTIAYFNRQLAYGGDSQTIDGILALIGSDGIGMDSLVLRFLPTYNAVYAAEAKKLFQRRKPTTGFICRTARMADAVSEAAYAMGFVPGKDIDICVCDYYLKPGERPRYPYARPVPSSEEQGRRLAQHLVSQVKHTNGTEKKIHHEVMPVQLELP